MKQMRIIGLFLTILMALGMESLAERVTFEWDIPGSIKIQLESLSGPIVDLEPDQTSYTLEEGVNFCYIYGADDYIVTGAQATNGKDAIKPNTTANGICIGGYFGTDSDGLIYKVDVKKVERDETFTIDIINGANYLSAKFNSGYELTLLEGSHEYPINPEYDTMLTISLLDIVSAYKVTLNGTEVEKNYFRPKYEEIPIVPGDKLVIQVFDGDEPKDCDVKFEYAPGMEGCIMNIYNKTTGQFIYPEDIKDATITVKEDIELRVNFYEDDYTITGLTLNGIDVTSETNGSYFIFTVKEENNVLKIDGKEREYSDIEFTGYIVNGDQLDCSLTFGGTPFSLPEGIAVNEDIIVSSSLTMPAETTKKYVFPISEKYGRFFFGPKKGSYISNVYTVTPEGTTEQQSGNSSISANIDGKVFYMVVSKLPEEYTANMNITGSDFSLRISSNSLLASMWSNPANPSYSSEEGKREIDFIPGYGTPIIFGFIGDENQQPAVYLDGAAVTGIEDTNSGAIEFLVTPWYPTDTEDESADLHSEIAVFNSFTERPKLSGASLQLEGGAEAEFFYSPLLHVADPAGQVVISGTQFTVRPASADVVVKYKDEVVELNENGEFVFNAIGNARSNIVTVSKGDTGIDSVIDADSRQNVTVYTTSGVKLLENQPASELNKLPKGIYIVNGKKTLIK